MKGGLECFFNGLLILFGVMVEYLFILVKD